MKIRAKKIRFKCLAKDGYEIMCGKYYLGYLMGYVDGKVWEMRLLNCDYKLKSISLHRAKVESKQIINQVFDDIVEV